MLLSFLIGKMFKDYGIGPAVMDGFYGIGLTPTIELGGLASKVVEGLACFTNKVAA